MTSKNDPIALIEAAYRLELSEPEWLEALIEVAAPLFDAPLGLCAFRYDASRVAQQPGVEVVAFAQRGDIDHLENARLANAMHDPDTAARLYSTGVQFDAASQRIPDRAGDFFGERAGGIADFLALHCSTFRGQGLVLGVPLPKPWDPRGIDRRPWLRLGVHLRTAMRLRSGAEDLTSLDGADAVFEADGRLAHAADEAVANAQERLRARMVAIDRARGALRRDDPSEAVEVWKGLVSGRWSLVDHFDRDGRRYVVARRNEPSLPDPRALTKRERQVVHFVGAGYTNKMIAYELGLAESTVATHLQRAMRKLGVAARVDLVPLVQALSGDDTVDETVDETGDEPGDERA